MCPDVPTSPVDHPGQQPWRRRTKRGLAWPTLPDNWYRRRLGMRQAGRVVVADPPWSRPSGALSEAFDHYCSMLGVGESHRWACTMRATEEDEYGDAPGRGDIRGRRWQPGPVLSPGRVGKDGASSRGGRLALSRQLAVANLWRAAMWLRLPGAGFDEDPVEAAMDRDEAMWHGLVKGHWIFTKGDREARRLLGDESEVRPDQPMGALRRVNLDRFRPTHWWLRAAPGLFRQGYLVVDVDWKHPEDEGRFRAVMRLLTSAPGMPRPHLIVTSRRGRGRHLYYFLREDGWSGMSSLVTPRQRTGMIRPSEAEARFRSALATALGLPRWPGHPGPALVDGVPVVVRGVEVKPEQWVGGGSMPSLPFSAGSFLCDEAGGVIERDPLAAMLAWHRRCKVEPISPYAADDLGGAVIDGADPELVAEVRRLVVVNRDPEAEVSGIARSAADAEGDESADDEPEGITRRSSDCRSVKAALSVYSDDPVPGNTHADLFLLARLRRYHLAPNTDPDVTPDDLTWFRHWIERHPSPDGADYVGQFATAKLRAQKPLVGWSRTGLVLTRADVRWCVREVLRLRPLPSWPKRKALLRVLAFIVGSARNARPTVGGFATAAVFHLDLQRRACRRHAAETAFLRSADVGVIEVVDGYVRPQRNGRPGRTTIYGITLPVPSSPLVEVDEALPDQLLATMIRADLGEELMGAINWRRLVRANPPQEDDE